MGNRLTREQAQELMEAPDTDTIRGARDQALLAVLLGGGLRRAEASRLTVEDIQQREGRRVIVDIISKHNRTRSISMSFTLR